MHRCALQFPVGIALFDVIAFVVLHLAFAEPERDLHSAVFPIEGERDEGMAFDGNLAEEFPDFGLVEKQFADGFGLMVLEITEAVFVDMGVVEEDLAVLDPGKGIADLALAGAQRFDLGAFEHNAGLICLEDVVIPPCFRIGENFGHKRVQPEGLPFWLRIAILFGSLASLALLGRFDKLQFFGEVETDFVIDDFPQSDVGDAEPHDFAYEGAAQRPTSGVQLPHTTRHEIHQDVGVADLG
jgi:hypothetical protein